MTTLRAYMACGCGILKVRRSHGENQTPAQVVAQTLATRSASIAFTYTEPTIFSEFAQDTALLSSEKGLRYVYTGNIPGDPGENTFCPTCNLLLKDDCLKTGDVGHLNANGHVTLTDRKKDVIIVSGFTVYPNEIGSVIQTHPGVLECGGGRTRRQIRRGGESGDFEEGSEAHQGSGDSTL